MLKGLKAEADPFVLYAPQKREHIGPDGGGRSSTRTSA